MTSIHGTLQQLAFFVLFPIGAVIAIARHHIGDGWLKYHVFFQLFATITVLMAVALQFVKRRKRDTKDPKMLSHIALGSAVTLLLILQVMWAFFGRHLTDWMTWYRIHIALATIIFVGGVTNILIAKSMH